LALAFQNPTPGQSCHEAIIMAQPSLAYLGLAWLGSWPQARPDTSLDAKMTNMGETARVGLRGKLYVVSK